MCCMYTLTHLLALPPATPLTGRPAQSATPAARAATATLSKQAADSDADAAAAQARPPTASTASPFLRPFHSHVTLSHVSSILTASLSRRHFAPSSDTQLTHALDTLADPHHAHKTRAFIKSIMEYEGLSSATASRVQTLLMVYSAGYVLNIAV